MSRMRLSTVLKAAAAIPCLVGFIGYSFTVIAVLFPDEEGCTSGYCPLLWFGGAQPFSLHHLWRSTETSTAADMLALHLPLFRWDLTYAERLVLSLLLTGSSAEGGGHGQLFV